MLVYSHLRQYMHLCNHMYTNKKIMFLKCGEQAVYMEQAFFIILLLQRLVSTDIRHYVTLFFK